MKWLIRTFYLLGFLAMYILPIILFGNVIPYTHDGVAAGLTGAGYIAACVVVFMISRKFSKWIHEQEKSLLRGLGLSIFPIIWWVVILLLGGWIGEFIGTFLQYWNRMIIFILLGRALFTTAEALTESERDKK